MIESITVSDTATYGTTPEVLDKLSKFNFIFGSNGSGKTTVSRIIASEDGHPTCKVTWKGGTKLEALVYNCDFIDQNFNQVSDLKGVFTLGLKQADTLEKINAAKTALDNVIGKKENLENMLQGPDGSGGKLNELLTLETELKDQCWRQHQKYDTKLHGAFKGYRNSAEKFKVKILEEAANNTALLKALTSLEEKAETVFGSTPELEPIIAVIDGSSITVYENDSILNKRVIGKADVDIARMIEKLGNSDWVKDGRNYYDKNDNFCPFCQSQTTASFAKSLTQYFDEAFLADTKAIEVLESNYSIAAERLRHQVSALLSTPGKFLEVEKLRTEMDLLEAMITINAERLVLKKKEPSHVVHLESMAHVLTNIVAIIDNANILILDHNAVINNLADERVNLTSEVWKFLLEQLKDELAVYTAKRSALDKAIAAIRGQISALVYEGQIKLDEIRQLEKETTSVEPTVKAINSLLQAFGFRNFTLKKAEHGTSYKLLRSNGTDAKTTLSEGEKTFITFLYFYHLLKGSRSESGMTTNRIVVFDDPVSSLDSDVLFIVGSLIKGIFEDVRLENGNIKQVFILTHNVYFHKEITFNSSRRSNKAMSEETFWMVRKLDMLSKFEMHDSNPIKTSYELLWSEMKRADRSNLTIQNTMRRILENYFKILGGVDTDKICGMFEGQERIICKSLFSWVNDGSHYAHDDLYVTIDNSMIESYIKVFERVFDEAGHQAHFRMMMGDG